MSDFYKPTGWPVPPPTGQPVPPILQGWESVKSPQEQAFEALVNNIVNDHTSRISDLEKQVAELRAAIAAMEGSDD